MSSRRLLKPIPAGFRAYEFPGYGTSEHVRVGNRSPPPASSNEATPLLSPADDTLARRPVVLMHEKHAEGGGGGGGGGGGDEENALAAQQQHHAEKPHALLGVLRSTAVSGNDIASSILYTAGICTFYAGRWSLLSLILVIVVLFCYRSVYAEAITALPLNGGTYTVLLNTTTKQLAAIAACLTLLSYTATCVVSADSAASYIVQLAPATLQAYINYFAAGLIVLFALLSLLGLKDSATVAVLIFTLHLATLTLLVIVCFGAAAYERFETLHKNFVTAEADWPALASLNYTVSPLAGYGAACLGITGFETAANFVEEQRPGVLVPTLNWLWFVVAVFNPLVELAALAVLDMPTAMGFPLDSTGQPNNAALLSQMALAAVPGQTWLSILVNVDAAIVLAGSVLTSYVGVVGLVRRMALDRCLPSSLLARNKRFGSDHVTIIVFAIFTCSLYFIVQGNIITLSGVYALAFLTVMFCFAIGCLVLKHKRADLPRQVIANTFLTVLAAVAIAVAWVANATLGGGARAQWFLVYFSGFFSVVAFMFYRLRLARVLAKWLQPRHKPAPLQVQANDDAAAAAAAAANDDNDDNDDVPSIPSPAPANEWRIVGWLRRFVERQYREFKATTLVILIRTPDLVRMNKMVLYVRENEPAERVRFVHISESDDVDPLFAKNAKLLDSMYPRLRIDFVAITGVPFSPAAVELMSQELGIPRHCMFMASPHRGSAFHFSDLQGVRIITHN
jgi:amino acid transporter